MWNLKPEIWNKGRKCFVAISKGIYDKNPTNLQKQTLLKEK